MNKKITYKKIIKINFYIKLKYNNYLQIIYKKILIKKIN